MYPSLFILILFLINFNQILSISLGKIDHLSIRSRNPIYPSSNINCTDCLCDCFNPSLSCSGINCFPSNRSCQLIDQQPWIFESNLLINLTSDNFMMLKENSSRLCSCYRPDQILNYYSENNSLTDYATTTTNISSVQYIPNDNTLIVFNSTIIRKLSASNLSIILRNLTASPDVIASILYNDTKIYIAFASNQSISMFDLNLTLQTSISWFNQSGVFGGMFLFNNQILIIDRMYSIIWSINSSDPNYLNMFFDYSPYNITNVTGLFIYQNQSLYISNLSNNLYLFNLTNFELQQILTLSVNISIFSMRYDSNCDRLWFGTSNYTYAPVLDLPLNQMNIYQTQGNLSTSGIFSMDFDLNYTIFYADVYGYVHRIYLPNIDC